MLTEEQQTSFMEARRHFETLPLDTYDKAANRYRQLTRFVLLPFAGLLVSRPYKAITYKQGIWASTGKPWVLHGIGGARQHLRVPSFGR